MKVLRVESRDFEVEAQKELGCPKAVGEPSWSTKTVNQGILADVFFWGIILPQLTDRNSEKVEVF